MNATRSRAPAQTTATKPVAPAPALPEAIDALDVLERLRAIGSHWHSIIDSVLETHQYHDKIYPDPVEPLPKWAADRLKDQGRHRSSRDEFNDQEQLLKDWLHMAAGDGHGYRYEVWTSRGSRLAFRHESWEEAAAVLDGLKAQHPTAFVAKIHVLNFGGIPEDPALLDTMIGMVSHIGTFMGGTHEEDEEQYTVQDATGRQVSVPASVLRRHPVFERMDERGKQRLDHYISVCVPRWAAARAARQELGE